MPGIFQSSAAWGHRPQCRQCSQIEAIRYLSCLSVLISGLSSICIAAENTPVAKEKQANRLINESSPYLLQHAHNPVDWFPWGEEAFTKARNENKPIFLSVGYSSCFWCHVMERKVFENEEIARYMNEHFVNIKVDREERPDVDEIYMLAVQVYFQLAGSAQGGGWPLSMFLTPTGAPIAGGTYFPPEDLPGRPGFLTVMQQLNSAWKEQEAAVKQTAAVLSREVQRLSQPSLNLSPKELSPDDFQAAIDAVISHYDPVHAGFDFNPDSPDEPKFPVPSKLMLIQAQLANNEQDTQGLAKKLDHSLDAMAAGGIYDHLAGGFHRYSTDREWRVPHFEKMLYDNAQLAEIYAEAYQRTRNRQYRETAEGILQFVLETMTDKSGAFYSALDAETDGIEGKYYVWSQQEIQEILSAGSYRYFAASYGLNDPPTFEHGYILHRAQPIALTAQKLGVPMNELETRLTKMRQQLLSQRQTRTPLRRDDKILTSWNGLMIRAFARAGKILERQDYLDHAAKAALYLMTTLRDQEGRLLRTARNHQASLPAYLDDYAFVVSGLLTLHDATGEEKWLSTARLLTDAQISLFWDSQSGGFFFTAHDHESLIARTKAAYDSVLPSGNSVSIQNLVRLAQRTGDSNYLDRAGKTISAFSGQFRQSPGNLPYFAMASQEYALARGRSGGTNGTAELFAKGISTPMQPGPAENKANTPLVPGLAAADSPDSDQKVAVAGYFNQNAGQAGEKIEVALVLNIAREWHINANPAQPDFVIPTQIQLTSPQDWKLSNVRYPPGKEFTLPGIDQPLLVYEDEIVIRGTLHIPAGTSGEVPVTVRLKYQACNSQSCIAPKRIDLSGKLEIFEAGKKPQRFNERLFQ